MSKYESSGGGAARTPEFWPPEANFGFDRARKTLVMFLHPQCPCSHASLEELNRILALHAPQISAHVCFFKPSGFPNDWVRSGLWRAAGALSGVNLHEDLDGAQARRFGAETSGFVLLYDTHGRLMFKG